MIAALFVQTNGVYFNLSNVDPWDEKRDARLYAGPWPVVAHPPCERWGRYWGGGPSARVPRSLGDDGGCFAEALNAVERWGGVLEHPEGSHAWRRFGIPTPPKDGGWFRTIRDGWTCCVEQGHYGHRARKATWLYYVGRNPPELRWGKSEGKVRLDQGRRKPGQKFQRMTGRELAATPLPFRDVLIAMAEGAAGQVAA